MRWLPVALLSMALPACRFDLPGAEAPEERSRTIEGTIVDFETGQPLGDAASVSTSGLVPAPVITTQGAAFTIAGVPDNSAFQILASASSHRPTFSEAVTVATEDLRGVTAPVVGDAFLAGLATGFGIAPSATRGVLLSRVVDLSGQPRAGVNRTSFMLDASVTGPFFLGDNRQPLPGATATSVSGWAVWFEVAPGIATLGTNATGPVTLDMAIAPVSAGTVTLARIRATDGAPVLPTNVSFQSHVVPIFRLAGAGGRGCAACHSSGGIGSDLGGLTLDGSPNLIYRELTEEDPLRVQLLMPERSQLLTYPSREDPPDRHPNVTFTGPLDPDYLKILVWIREGAKDN